MHPVTTPLHTPFPVRLPVHLASGCLWVLVNDANSLVRFQNKPERIEKDHSGHTYQICTITPIKIGTGTIQLHYISNHEDAEPVAKRSLSITVTN